ncbi:CidA/LrgA family protein [Pseudoalteromonas sp. S558]|uniref:CidA/LrgA family protein n=1 Tax=Pseudoalteromonas sp. S558 TaxID=2066515 RepID=UPI00110AE18B|nr:CidA/LrgA family protein [Pseudoalteromonas sp. S558]TMO03509.1 CidA/LrgA family protein [Pseudoalteromonas sp. S558]
MKFLLSSTIILLCLAVAKLIMHIMGGSFPAPLLAMVILLVLLLSGLVKEQHIKPCAAPILNIMPIFFIPAGVGFIEHLGLIKSQWPFLVSIVVFIPLSSLLLISSVIAYFKGRKNND